MSVMTPLNTGRVVLCLPVVGMFLWEVITCEGFVLFQFEFVYSFSVYLNILIFFASHGFCKYIAYCEYLILSMIWERFLVWFLSSVTLEHAT